MAEKLFTQEDEKLNTIIGQGTVLKGECSVSGTVRVDGTIDGTLKASGVAILGKSGQIKGDLLVQNAVVGGRVEGSVLADNRLELQTGAMIQGDIKAKKLIVEEGVYFQGHCAMQEAKQAAAAPEKKKLSKEEAKEFEDELEKVVKEELEIDQDEGGEGEITYKGKPI